MCSCLITGSSNFFSGNNSSKASWISGIISVVVIFRRYLANASLLQVLVSAQAPYAATRDRPYEHALREERKRQLLILLTVLVTGDLPFITIIIFSRWPLLRVYGSKSVPEQTIPWPKNDPNLLSVDCCWVRVRLGTQSLTTDIDPGIPCFPLQSLLVQNLLLKCFEQQGVCHGKQHSNYILKDKYS